MPDWEKVHMGLKCHMKTRNCQNGGAVCPYFDEDKCSEHLCQDALALLEGDREKITPHRVSEVVCLVCKKRWVAVRPEGTKLKDLECLCCGRQGYVIETGEEIVDDA